MEDKPSINKGNKKPVNPSKRKNPRLINGAVKKINGKFKLQAVRKNPRPLHNEALTKGGVDTKKHTKNVYSESEKSDIDWSKVINYGAFANKKKKDNTKKILAIIAIVVIILLIIIKMVSCSINKSNAKKEVFKGKEYFAYLGIHEDTPYEDVLYETDDLVEVDGIALGVFAYDGEEYYRFQAIKNGVKAYDSEITNRQGTRVSVVAGIKPKVEVYKRTYTKENNDKQTIYYYKLYVPDDKIKKLS